MTKLFRLRKLAPVKLPISNICLPGPPIAGQIVSAVKEGCRQAFLKQPCRLMIAMYKCEIQVPNIFCILLCVVVVVGLFLHFWSMRNTTNKRIMNCLTNKTTTLTTVNVIMHLSLMNIHVSVFRQLLKCWDESMEFWQNAKEESYARNWRKGPVHLSLRLCCLLQKVWDLQRRLGRKLLVLPCLNLSSVTGRWYISNFLFFETLFNFIYSICFNSVVWVINHHPSLLSLTDLIFRRYKKIPSGYRQQRRNWLISESLVTQVHILFLGSSTNLD